MKRNADRQAFTLIELLVVIAIITLIAAILFPVFASAREKARQTECMSNLKQMGEGVLQYVQDNDESWPYDACGDHLANALGCTQGTYTTSTLNNQNAAPGYNPANDDPFLNLGLWMTEIYPYIKTTQIYQEPSSEYMVSSACPQTNMVGYFSNGAAWFDPTTSAANPGPRTEASMNQNVSQNIIVYDNLNKHSQSGQPSGFGNARYLYYRPFLFTGAVWTDLSSFTLNQFRVGPHDLIYNALYADGHAKGLTQSGLLNGIMPTDASPVYGNVGQALWPH